MEFLESDLTYWALAVLLAVSGLIRLATRRREQLTELLRSYVAKHQSPSAESNERST